jgi:hypothetical protein
MISKPEGRLLEIAKQINRTPPWRVPFEDLVMSEVVDDRHRPISDGLPEDWSLVTVLFSRTLLLIRLQLPPPAPPA